MTYMSEIITAIVATLVVEGFRIGVLPILPTWWPTGGTRVPRVRGTWRYDDGILEIRQYGTKIKARAIRTSQSPRHFNYKGKIIGGQLVLTWEQAEGAGFIVGAMVLRLDHTGRTLNGMTTYVHHDTGEVRSRERRYTLD